MTPTETGFRALIAALTAAAQVAGSPLVVPARNEDLISRLTNVGSDLALFLNVLDGDHTISDELLGADIGNTAAYEIEAQAEIEWAVAGGENDARETRFDDGRLAIWDAIKPDLGSGSPVYLGGAVDGIRFVQYVPHIGTNAARAGIPNVKACSLVIAFAFTSPTPF